MSLSQHFKNAGIRTHWDPIKADRELANRYGRKRYEAFCHIADDFRSGSATIRDLYLTPTTLTEAGLLMSQQGGIAFDLAEAVVDAAAPMLGNAARVADLGCWTGPLAAHVAAEHAGAEVVGIDREPDVIRWAEDAHDLPNLSFAEWDYTESPPAYLGRSTCSSPSSGSTSTRTPRRQFLRMETLVTPGRHPATAPVSERLARSSRRGLKRRRPTLILSRGSAFRTPSISSPLSTRRTLLAGRGSLIARPSPRRAGSCFPWPYGRREMVLPPIRRASSHGANGARPFIAEAPVERDALRAGEVV